MLPKNGTVEFESLVRIGVAHMPPYTFWELNDTRPSGFATEVLVEVLLLLGYKYQFVRFHNQTELYNAMAYNNCLFNIHVSANLYGGNIKRFEEIVYGVPISFYRYFYLIPLIEKQAQLFSMDFLIKPFAPFTWMAVLGSQIVVFLLMAIAKHCISERLDFFDIFAAISNQNSQKSNGRAFNLISTFRLFFNFTLTSMYSALILRTILEENRVDIPFRSSTQLGVLINQSEWRVAAYQPANNVMFRFLAKSREDRIRQFGTSLVHGLTHVLPSEMIDFIDNTPKTVALTSDLTAHYILNDPSVSHRCPYVVIPATVFANQWQSFVFPKGQEKLANEFQNVLLWMKGRGNEVNQKSTYRGQDCFRLALERGRTGLETKHPNVGPIKLGLLRSVFLVFSLVSLVCVTSLLCEKVSFWGRNRRTSHSITSPKSEFESADMLVVSDWANRTQIKETPSTGLDFLSFSDLEWTMY